MSLEKVFEVINSLFQVYCKIKKHFECPSTEKVKKSMHPYYQHSPNTKWNYFSSRMIVKSVLSIILYNFSLF